MLRTMWIQQSHWQVYCTAQAPFARRLHVKICTRLLPIWTVWPILLRALLNRFQGRYACQSTLLELSMDCCGVHPSTRALCLECMADACFMIRTWGIVLHHHLREQSGKEMNRTRAEQWACIRRMASCDTSARLADNGRTMTATHNDGKSENRQLVLKWSQVRNLQACFDNFNPQNISLLLSERWITRNRTYCQRCVPSIMFSR